MLQATCSDQAEAVAGIAVQAASELKFEQNSTDNGDRHARLTDDIVKRRGSGTQGGQHRIKDVVVDLRGGRIRICGIISIIIRCRFALGSRCG